MESEPFGHAGLRNDPPTPKGTARRGGEGAASHGAVAVGQDGVKVSPQRRPLLRLCAPFSVDQSCRLRLDVRSIPVLAP